MFYFLRSVAQDMDVRHITTEHDIKSLLELCRRCRMLTNNATHIMTHSQLPNITLSTRKQKTHGLIINSESAGRLGHWFTLLIYNNQFLIVCDGLCKAMKESDIASNILRFSRRNNLILKDLNFRCQPSNSLKCGYIALFFIAKASKLQYRSFLNMVNMLTQNSVRSREDYVLKYVVRHFKLFKQ